MHFRSLLRIHQTFDHDRCSLLLCSRQLKRVHRNVTSLFKKEKPVDERWIDMCSIAACLHTRDNCSSLQYRSAIDGSSASMRRRIRSVSTNAPFLLILFARLELVLWSPIDSPCIRRNYAWGTQRCLIEILPCTTIWKYFTVRPSFAVPKIIFLD
jgi:hypothetical protein